MSGVNPTGSAGTPQNMLGANNQTPTATVKEGETLDRVAERLGVSADDLRSANPQLGDSDGVKAGQELQIPESKGTTTADLIKGEGTTAKDILTGEGTTTAKILGGKEGVTTAGLLHEKFAARQMKATQSLTENTTKTAGKATLTGNGVPTTAAAILGEIFEKAGIDSAQINRTSSTPAKQAQIMYDNGVDIGRDMYGKTGDKVIDLLEEKKDTLPRQEVIDLMTDKINELGPGNVSRHCSDKHIAIDISPGSIPKEKHAALKEAALAHPAVDEFLDPSNSDPALHIAIDRSKLK